MRFGRAFAKECVWMVQVQKPLFSSCIFFGIGFQSHFVAASKHSLISLHVGSCLFASNNYMYNPLVPRALFKYRLTNVDNILHNVHF